MKQRYIGASTACLADYSLMEAVRKIRDMGFGSLGLLAFDGVRHSVGDLAGFCFDDLGEEERDELKKALDGFDRVFIHAPFVDVPLFTPNNGGKREAMRQLKEAIEAAWYLGADVVTVHANRKRSFELPEYWEEMVDVFNELGDFAEGCDVRLGIETGFPDTVETYTRLFADINHESVGATIDVGHLVSHLPREVLESSNGVARYNETLIRIVQTLGSLVYHLHLHDVRRSDWRDHRCVGRGIIDFRMLFGFLDRIGYSGGIELELEEMDKAAALSESKRYLEGMFEEMEILDTSD